MPFAVEIAISGLLLIGGAFALIGSLGLAKLSDFYRRLHGPTKATTLGIGSLLIASALYFTLSGPGFSVHEIAITVFLFLTAPVSAHLLVRAALHLQDAGGPR
jgi:multicomponent K+:H+ antiporter subunit G